MAVTPAPGIHLAATGTFPRLTRGWASPRDLAPGRRNPGSLLVVGERDRGGHLLQVAPGFQQLGLRRVFGV